MKLMKAKVLSDDVIQSAAANISVDQNVDYMLENLREMDLKDTIIEFKESKKSKRTEAGRL